METAIADFKWAVLRRTDEFSAKSPGRRPSAPTQRRLLSLPRHTQRLDAGLPPSTRRPQTTDKAAYPGDPYQAFVQQLEREGFRVLSRAALRPDVVS